MRTFIAAWAAGAVFVCVWCADPGRGLGQTALEKLEKSIRKQVGLTKAAAEPAPQSQGDRQQGAEKLGKPVNSGKAGMPGPEAATDRGYLGAVVDDRKDRGRGVRVERVIPGGPAEKAGLRVGDLITGLGGVRVRQMADFAAIVEQVVPGNSLTFEILRGENREKIDVTFGPRLLGKKPGTAVLPKSPEMGAFPGPPVPRPPLAAAEAGAGTEKIPLEPPGPPSLAPSPRDNANRIELLYRRIEQLERRIEELERALKTRPAK
jgi:membrane-associated protease RseP (regulator of RpoE activity)